MRRSPLPALAKARADHLPGYQALQYHGDPDKPHHADRFRHRQTVRPASKEHHDRHAGLFAARPIPR